MNSVNITGRLTRDPELRYTPSGKAVVRFTLAVDRRLSKEKRAEAEAKNQQTADFISCIAWNKTAELIANYLEKGKRIGVSGRLQSGNYEKDGRVVYTTDVIVETMEFLDSSNNSNQASAGGFKPSSSLGNELEQQGFYPIDNDDIPF